MKKFLVILLAISAVMLVSCASNKIGGEKVPTWVITEPASDAEFIYASGSGKHSDFDIAYKMAKADAMNNLAKKIGLNVNDTVQTTVTSGGDNSRKYEENAIQTTDVVIKMADVKDYYERKDGTVYILMYMPLTKD